MSKKNCNFAPQSQITMKKIIYLFVVLIALISCGHQPKKVAHVAGEILLIDTLLNAQQDSNYLDVLLPIKMDLETKLNIPIGYAPQALDVHKPECTMLNWASDALLAVAQELYPNHVDMAVVNIGGMRCDWRAGDITFRHVFELMPFDNELVVLTLQGKDLLALCKLFAAYGGQGVAGLRMRGVKGVLKSATIAGKDIVPEAYYTVATSDYLSQGNDGMTPLKNYIDLWKSDKKIRDLYIGYIEQVKTVEATVDGRMDVSI